MSHLLLLVLRIGDLDSPAPLSPEASNGIHAMWLCPQRAISITIVSSYHSSKSSYAELEYHVC